MAIPGNCHSLDYRINRNNYIFPEWPDQGVFTREEKGVNMYFTGLFIGLTAGIVGGLVGIGGGIIIIPSIVIFLNMEQHIAQGTALAAMLPPIYILAVLQYYFRGHVNIPVAAMIAAGLLTGGFIGARIAVEVDAAVLRKIFGFLLLVLSIIMIVKK